jgi:hypothetical protein
MRVLPLLYGKTLPEVTFDQVYAGFNLFSA